MNFKNFNEYIKQYSTDPMSFINRIAVVTNKNIDFPYFDYIKTKHDLTKNNKNIPIIILDDNIKHLIHLDESSEFIYSFNKLPPIDMIFDDFKNHDFIVNQISDIKNIKKLKFPIFAYHNNEIDEFKTIGKLRASNKIYEKFREKIVPLTKFKVISFKGEPVSIVEQINKFSLDVDINRFILLDEVYKITNALHEKYNLDFCSFEILESVNKKIYLNNINKNIELNPHEAFKVYEISYNDYYSSRLPNWIKDKIINESINKYYKKKSYDSMLIQSRHALNYSKIK